MKIIHLTLVYTTLFIIYSCNNLKDSSQNAGEAVPPPSPNIIFIMADDLGFGDLGVYGQKIIQTPNLDQMAKEGLRFTNCYAGSPVCAPSRSVLMTGFHTGHTTVRGNNGKGGVVGLGGKPGRIPLKASDITIASMLQKNGYTTGIIGKWGLGEPNTTGEPNDHGFDEWFGYLNQRRAHHYYPEFLWHNKEKYPIPENEGGAYEVYSHDLFMEKTYEFVKTNKDNPFFLYLPLTIPHDLYEIPSKVPYDDKPWTEDEKTHAAMITRMDSDLGKLFALLKELKIEENTVIFFCSDNGAARRWEGRFDSSGDLRGRKRDVYEGGIRTPMIVKWPNKISPNSLDSVNSWYFADVFPTLLEIAGIDQKNDRDGISVLPTLLGENQKELKERPLYWEFLEQEGKQALRKGDWKVVRLDVHKKGFHTDLELYNVREDPAEERNLAQKNPEKVAELMTIMDEQHILSGFFPFEFETVQ
ncbi:arylsulfatase [Flexithrix dorotheae]|uniref:arylsulfatase n=1 Tax=Flexithrix dorotheae TaxID=70993 RepID=UPI000381801B|nr:arylsulfatase [Flexithrix dorotheae]